MQKIIGITGNIGSGKTTVSRLFEELGAILYNCDTRAKELMQKDEGVRENIIKLLGADAYKENRPDREWIAKKVFQNEEKLKTLEGIVHPAVQLDFEFFKNENKSKRGYILYESALLFKGKRSKRFDKIILVDTPKKTRIQRVMQRDNCTEKQVLKIMQNQMGNEQKKAFCDFVIENTNLKNTTEQVIKIHKKIIN